MRIASLALHYLWDVFRVTHVNKNIVRSAMVETTIAVLKPVVKVPNTMESQMPTCLGSQHHPEEDE